VEAWLNGIDVHYERRGAGLRLLFLTGSGSTIASSGPLLDVFAKSFEVLVHDQRGLGRTAVPPGPYTMADYAEDAVALLDHVGWDRCRMVGVSFGGMVAQEFAVTWPSRVERLALLCTSPGGKGGASYPLHELADRPVTEQIEVGLSILDTRFTREWLASHPSDQALVDMVAKSRAGIKTDEQRRGVAEQLQARRRHDVCDRLHDITCPTLVASGAFDGIAPPTNGDAIASRIPAARREIYQGGHAFFAQDARALPDIIAFLGEDALDG
jgi:pimeloyl-ACP methyl ester carboxylesterase